MDFTYLKDFMDRLSAERVPGNSAVVYLEGKKVFSYSSGYSDMENGIKMTGDELLYIYSCSKPVTAAAAMQLYEKGYFLLSDPLYAFIPEFKNMTVMKDGELHEAKNPITMKQLFTMTAGFSYNTQTPAFKKAAKLTNGKMNTLEVVRCIAEEPLQFEPGEHWSYSLCHDVLAAVVEVISGQRFSEYVKHNIFEPLGMNNSYYHIDNLLMKKMAEQYICEADGDMDIVRLQNNEKDGGLIKNNGKTNSLVFGEDYDSGGAGIITTVEDYGLFGAAMADKGTGINGSRILSPATVNLIKTNQLNDVQLKDMNWRRLKGYGYGLGVRTMINAAESGSNGSVGEIGWGGAAGANLLVDTDKRLAAAYAHHMLNPQEEYYQPRLRNILYSCIDQ